MSIRDIEKPTINKLNLDVNRDTKIKILNNSNEQR